MSTAKGNPALIQTGTKIFLAGIILQSESCSCSRPWSVLLAAQKLLTIPVLSCAILVISFFFFTYASSQSHPSRLSLIMT